LRVYAEARRVGASGLSRDFAWTVEIANAPVAIAELGYTSGEPELMVAIENTDRVHNSSSAVSPTMTHATTIRRMARPSSCVRASPN
jgi:hypothetical protein